MDNVVILGDRPVADHATGVSVTNLLCHMMHGVLFVAIRCILPLAGVFLWACLSLS